MQTVAAVTGGEKVGERYWVAHDSVEINQGVELGAGPDPRIDRLAHSFMDGRVIAASPKRRDRGAVGTDVPRVRLIHELRIGVGQALSTGPTANVVNTSTPVMIYQCAVLAAVGRLAAERALPGWMKEVVLEPGCPLMVVAEMFSK
jgi:hypothetical protein